MPSKGNKHKIYGLTSNHSNFIRHDIGVVFHNIHGCLDTSIKKRIVRSIQSNQFNASVLIFDTAHLGSINVSRKSNITQFFADHGCSELLILIDTRPVRLEYMKKEKYVHGKTKKVRYLYLIFSNKKR